MNARSTRFGKTVASMLFASTLVFGPQIACKSKSAPVAIPEDKKVYLGYWTSADGTFNLSDDGTISFEKKSAGSSSKVNGNFAGFDGNNIKVSLGLGSKTLTVQTPPADANGVSTMTIEGITLTKKGEASSGKDSRERLANSIRDTFLKKSIIVRGVTCPVAANSPNSGDFACVLETPSGEKFNVNVKRTGTDLSYELDAAALGADKIEKFIEEGYEKETHHRATAKCPAGVIVKKPGDQFTCDFSDDKTKKQYKATVTVDDKGGKVHVKY